MKLRSGMLAAALLLAGIGARQAAVRIANDRGGRIDSYLDIMKSWALPAKRW